MRASAGETHPIWTGLEFKKQPPRSAMRPNFFAALVLWMRQCEMLLDDYPAFTVEFRGRAAAETEC